MIFSLDSITSPTILLQDLITWVTRRVSYKKQYFSWTYAPPLPGGDCVAHLFNFLSWLVFSWFVILRSVSCMHIVASVSGLSIIERLFVFLKALFSQQLLWRNHILTASYPRKIRVNKINSTNLSKKEDRK